MLNMTVCRSVELILVIEALFVGLLAVIIALWPKHRNSSSPVLSCPCLMSCEVFGDRTVTKKCSYSVGYIGGENAVLRCPIHHEPLAPAT